jgi:hypothetical protein
MMRGIHLKRKFIEQKPEFENFIIPLFFDQEWNRSRRVFKGSRTFKTAFSPLWLPLQALERLKCFAASSTSTIFLSRDEEDDDVIPSIFWGGETTEAIEEFKRGETIRDPGLGDGDDDDDDDDVLIFEVAAVAAAFSQAACIDPCLWTGLEDALLAALPLLPLLALGAPFPATKTFRMLLFSSGAVEGDRFTNFESVSPILGLLFVFP